MNRFCPRCGAELTSNNKYCPKCGHELKMLPPDHKTQPVTKPSYADQMSQVKTTPKNPAVNTINRQTPPAPQPPAPHGSGKAVIAAICAVALIGAGIGGLYLLNNKKPSSVNMNPYLTVSFQGVDGEGYADCEFDLAKLVSDHEKAFSLDDEKRKKIKQICHIDESKDLSDSELITSLFADMYDNGPVSVHIEPATGLSNDEKVSVIWDGGEETLEDLFGVNFIFDHSSYTVTDLEKSDRPAQEEKKADEEKSNTETAEVKEETVESNAVAETEEVEEAVTFVETVEEEKPAEAPAPTQKPASSKPKNYGKYKLSNTDYLTLRSSPTINNKNNKLLQIPADSEVTVLEFGCNGYWKVKYNGTEGYILPSYLAPAKGAVSPKKTAEYRIITDYVTLRDIPSTDGVAKTTIYNGAVVECYDTADNGFILVQYEGQLGYILKNYNGEVLVEKL